MLHGVTPGRYPVTELANLPFGFPAAEAQSPEMAKRLTELAPKYLAAEHTGLHILFLYHGRRWFSFRGSDQDARRLQGHENPLRLAHQQELLDSLGAATLLIPPPDSQDALNKGIVQAATFPHEAGLAYDLASAVKYAIQPPVASATFAMAMNPAKYNSLPPDLKALLDKESGVAAAVSFGTAWKDQEKHALDRDEAKGLQIHTLPPGEVAKLKELAKPTEDKSIDDLENKTSRRKSSSPPTQNSP